MIDVITLGQALSDTKNQMVTGIKQSFVA